MPNQQSVHFLSGAYAVDALDDDERIAFERHLSRCPECQEEVASLHEAAILLSSETSFEPPPSLRDAVLGAASQVRPLPPLVDRAGPTVDDTVAPGDGATVLPFRRRLRAAAGRGRLAGVAAAAVVVAVVGVGVSQPWSPDDSRATYAASQVLDASDAVSVSQSFPDGSSATLTHSSDEGRAVLQTRDMADPPEQSVFEMWLLDEDGQATPAGLMEDGGDVTALLEGDATDATAVALTVEPEGGSEQPTSEPIAMFDLADA